MGTHGFDDALTDEIFSGVWRYCCRLAPTREDAQDLLQDTLSRGIRAFGSLRDKASFRPWLLSIARRTWLMRLRTAGRRPQSVPDYSGQAAAPEQDAFARDVLDTVSAMPPAERELLVLYYIEGLDLGDVARVTGRSYGAVRQGLLRARRTLRDRVLADNNPAIAISRTEAEVKDG